MNDYLLLMHGDSPRSDSRRGDSDAGDAWGPYIQKLKAAGHFKGGSSVGAGVCINKSGKTVRASDHIVGFITVHAESLEQARELVAGNPVYEAGGTVEIRELPKT